MAKTATSTIATKPRSRKKDKGDQPSVAPAGTAAKPERPPRPTATDIKARIRNKTPMSPRRAPGPDRKTSPEAQLGMAEVALNQTKLKLKKQMYFRENRFWAGQLDGNELYKRLTVLDEIFDEKGLLKSKRDLTYDWVDFRKKVDLIDQEIMPSVAAYLIARAERMMYNTEVALSDKLLDELWADAVAIGKDPTKEPYKVIAGFGAMIRHLRGKGCTDPDDPNEWRPGGNGRR